MTGTTGPAVRAIDGIVARGEIGGRTVQIVDTGAVECAFYEPAPLADGHVRVRTVRRTALGTTLDQLAEEVQRGEVGSEAVISHIDDLTLHIKARTAA